MKRLLLLSMALFGSLQAEESQLPSHHFNQVFKVKIAQGQTLYGALTAQGWSGGQVMRLQEQVRDQIDLTHLFVDDEFEVDMEDGEVKAFSLTRSGRVRSFDLHSAHAAESPERDTKYINTYIN